MADVVLPQVHNLPANDLHTSQSYPSSTDEESLSLRSPSQFSFPSVAPPQTASHRSQHTSPPVRSSHNRSRTSINALPAFSFNPGASNAFTSNPPPNTAATRDENTPVRPSKGGRHRRSVSEFIGGNSPRRVARGVPAKIEWPERLEAGDLLSNPAGIEETSDGDVSAAGQQSFPVQRSATRVGFRETVELIPRPTSITSTESESSLSGAREASPDADGAANSIHTPPDWSPIKPFHANLPPSPEYHQERLLARKQLDGVVHVQPPSIHHPHIHTLSRPGTDTEIRTSAAHQTWAFHGHDITLGGVSYPARQSSDASLETSSMEPDPKLFDLSEDFDDDPTSYIVTAPDEIFHSIRESRQAHQSSCAGDDANNSVIDLDSALDGPSGQESRGSAVRSFQAARRSMHSSGVLSGFMGQGMRHHKRAESAPSLAPGLFDHQSFQNGPDATASEKGFEMDNVFEEEEEGDEDADSFEEEAVDEIGSQQGSAYQTATTKNGGNGLAFDTNSLAAPVRSHPAGLGLGTTMNTGAVQAHPSQTRSRSSAEHARDRLVLAPPHAPFMAPDTPSTSSFPSPKCSCSGHGSNEHSPALRRSVDDVPSLVSSESTRVSAKPGRFRKVASRSATPNFLSSMNSLDSERDPAARRSSIVSLSKLIGRPGGGEKQRPATGRSVPARLMKEPGNGGKMAKSSRLGRVLKLFKPKEAES